MFHLSVGSHQITHKSADKLSYVNRWKEIPLYKAALEDRLASVTAEMGSTMQKLIKKNATGLIGLSELEALQTVLKNSYLLEERPIKEELGILALRVTDYAWPPSMFCYTGPDRVRTDVQ